MACDCVFDQPGIRHPPTSIYDEVGMLRFLYAGGWGYHQIADLLRLPHEAVRSFLVAGPPQQQAEFIERGGLER